MLSLSVQGSGERNRTARARLYDGMWIVVADAAVASSTPEIATLHGNPGCDPLRHWGHPPFGSYRLRAHRPATPQEFPEYGSHLLLFEPEAGEALEAESYGHFGLLVYSGPVGGDSRMRRTQGGVRLTARMRRALVDRLRPGEEMVLGIAPLRAPSWWQFWKRSIITDALSRNLPALLTPPADEHSLLERLWRDVTPRPPVREFRDDSWGGDRDRNTDAERNGGSRGDTSRFGGGETGDGGAGGSWAEVPGLGQEVDSAGRILGAAAVIEALAVGKSESADSGAAVAPADSEAALDSASASEGDPVSATAY